ncbi:hypothetical protein AB1Y20_007083 [Prymnesium parvum]|uniref:HAT C-terminal dimerisation domain-containing protein n=1 Tax=Prymnesium parvum TaxID=97485 RepID=A0AB34IZW8_PRYPA
MSETQVTQPTQGAQPAQVAAEDDEGARQYATADGADGEKVPFAFSKPIHTFAYAVDPCYQAHDLTRQERADCLMVIKKLAGSDWPKMKVEFDRWRSSGQSLFPEEVWAAADRYHGYQWWESFGDDFEWLQSAAMKVLSKCMSASACEFNWSDVGQVTTKKTNRLTNDRIESIVNVRAMHRLEKSIATNKLLLGNLPKLDDFLDELVNTAIHTTEGGGDDVPDAEGSEEDSDDDEDFDIVAEDEDPLYELSDRNAELEAAVLHQC